MSDLVQLQLSKIFSDFRARVERLQDAILKGAQPIVRRNWGLSVSGGLGTEHRWFRTGATLQSAKDEFGGEGDRKFYRLISDRRSERGAPVSLFGEYGTGRAGALTGRPAPPGWRYGQKPGMRARRFARHALAIATPQVNLMAMRKARQFAQNATVS